MSDITLTPKGIALVEGIRSSLTTKEVAEIDGMFARPGAWSDAQIKRFEALMTKASQTRLRRKEQ